MTAEPRSADILRKRQRGTATLETVGELAGVSRSTVSRVINKSPGVSEQAIAAVHKAIAELGYVTNHAAKNLATRRALAVTVLVPEDMDRFFGDPFFGSIMRGIESEIEGTDLVLNMAVASEGSLEKTIDYLAGGQTNGILVFSHHSSHRLIAQLESRVPIVYGGKPIGDPEGKMYVDIDNVEAGRKAGRYLVKRGCERVAVIGGPADMPSAVEREAGVLEITGAADKQGPIEPADYSSEGGRRAAVRLLRSGVPFDGLFAANDLMARAAVRVFIQAGLRVPEDVAVVGFDDSKAAVTDHPHLTTVRQDVALQGKWMARLLLQQLDGTDTGPRAVILPTELVVRESA